MRDEHEIGLDEKTTTLKRLAHFAEELSWLIKDYGDLDFSSIADDVSELTKPKPSQGNSASKPKSRSDYGKQRLVGVLPGYFMNKRHFPQKKDLIEFAEKVLNMKSRPLYNLSKADIVGRIICHVDAMPESEVEKIPDIINVTTENDGKSRSGNARTRRDKKKGWNTVIRELAEGTLRVERG